MNKLIISSIIFSFILLFSCNDKVFYHNKNIIANSNWKHNDTLNFNVNITDTSQLYDLFFTIVNSNEYSNSNLWLFVNTKSPENFSLEDTLELFLSDEKGKWYGKKSSNKFKSFHYFKRQVVFSKKGIYSFSVRQGMRHLNLNGINEFGLMIKKSGKKQIK